MHPQFLSLLRNNFLRSSSSGPTSPSKLWKTLKPIPATFLRGGTSKGVFLQEQYLPHNRSHWDPIFLGIMGSPDPKYGRQLDGMGGGISSLSKICVVGPPTTEQASQGIHVQYTFVQVGIQDRAIDYSGNCGNLSSMIGVFAVDEGLCKPHTKDDGLMSTTVRSFNTNTRKVIDTTFPVTHDGVPLLDLPQTSIAGVSGTASRIILDFVNPGGARTGKLLPTTNPTDVLEVSSDGHNLMSFTASLVDATNPTVFLSYNELAEKGLPMEDYINGVQPYTTRVGSLLESLRQEGAKKMGLDPCTQAQPKVAFLRSPNKKVESNSHICVYALSMGALHKAVPMTVGLCLGVASKIEGTIPWKIINRRDTGNNSNIEFITLRHPGGVVDVGARFDEVGNVTSANVIRTGRRLMKGSVWW